MGNEPPAKSPSTEEQEPPGLTISNVLEEIVVKKIESPSERNQFSQQVRKCLKDPVKDRALGCLFGALMGDSLGSFCEFSNTISDRLIDQVMKMPGGGVFDLKPGQVTDDSQLASSLLTGLNQLDTTLPFHSQYYTLARAIAIQYVTWLQSEPFDVGITCRKAITYLTTHMQELKQRSEQELKPLFAKIFQEIDHENKDSESNGSLMRITPMAILFACSKMKVEEHEQFIKNEVRLTHSKKIAQQAGYLWVHTLTQLIMRKNDEPSTFQGIFEETSRLDKEEVLEGWFEQSKKEMKMPANVKIGWAKIAWTYSMQELYRLGTSTQTFDQNYYKKVVREVIKQGGDTDTNGCIVGGMLGALVGFKNLPPWYIQKLLTVELKENHFFVTSQTRPLKYEPFRVLLEAVEFIQKCEIFSKGQEGGRPAQNNGI